MPEYSSIMGAQGEHPDPLEQACNKVQLILKILFFSSIFKKKDHEFDLSFPWFNLHVLAMTPLNLRPLPKFSQSCIYVYNLYVICINHRLWKL